MSASGSFSETRGNLGNDLKEGARRVRRDVEGAAGDVQTDMKDTARAAGRHVRDFVDNATSDIAEATDAVADSIRHRPLLSGIIALTAGFVLGSIFTRH